MDKYQVIQSPSLANSSLEGCAVLITVCCTKGAENVSQRCRKELSGCLEPATAGGLGLRWSGLFWSMGRTRAVSLEVKAHPARTPLSQASFPALLPITY